LHLLLLNFFDKVPRKKKFWTKIVKSNTLAITVQNFAAIGQWSSEISRGEKEQMPAKHKFVPKAIASGRIKKSRSCLFEVSIILQTERLF